MARCYFRIDSCPMFLVVIVMMVCSGASELAMAQWASAYAESALGFSKAVGDIAGCIVCGFSVGIMWPGTISISSKAFSSGETAIFENKKCWGSISMPVCMKLSIH